jgi:hypothetical protein
MGNRLKAECRNQEAIFTDSLSMVTHDFYPEFIREIPDVSDFATKLAETGKEYIHYKRH